MKTVLSHVIFTPHPIVQIQANNPVVLYFLLKKCKSLFDIGVSDLVQDIRYNSPLDVRLWESRPHPHQPTPATGETACYVTQEGSIINRV